MKIKHQLELLYLQVDEGLMCMDIVSTFHILYINSLVCLSRSRNEPHLAWNVPALGVGCGGGETHARWIFRLPTQTVCLWQKQGPEMSRTWPKMFQR